MLVPFVGSAPFPYAGELAAALSALLWASAGIVFASIRPPVAAATLNLGKNIAASFCFIILLLVTTGAPWPTGVPRESLVMFALSGLAGLSICDTLLMRSLLTIGPQRMHLIMSITPVIIAVAAIFPPFEEHPSLLAWVGIGVVLLGIVLAILEKPTRSMPDHEFRRGVIDALFAALFQATGVLLARWGLQVAAAEGATTNAADGAMIRMVCGTLGMAVIGLPALRILTWGRQLLNKRVATLIFVASFFGTFLGIWLNQISLEWAEYTGVASVLNSLMPIYLIPLTAIFLGERHTVWGWVATLVAVSGIALIALSS